MLASFARRGWWIPRESFCRLYPRENSAFPTSGRWLGRRSSILWTLGPSLRVMYLIVGKSAPGRNWSVQLQLKAEVAIYVICAVALYWKLTWEDVAEIHCTCKLYQTWAGNHFASFSNEFPRCLRTTLLFSDCFFSPLSDNFSYALLRCCPCIIVDRWILFSLITEISRFSSLRDIIGDTEGETERRADLWNNEAENNRANCVAFCHVEYFGNTLINERFLQGVVYSVSQIRWEYRRAHRRFPFFHGAVVY